MGTWLKLTSKSLACQTYQLTPALSPGSPRGMARCRTTPQTPKKTQWPLAVLCREAPGRYSPPQAKCRFSTNRGLRCVVGVFWCGAKQIARTLADGYVATSQWIQDRLQWDPRVGQGEWPRHEIDLLCCDSIPALTEKACVLQSDRTMLLAGLKMRSSSYA